MSTKLADKKQKYRRAKEEIKSQIEEKYAIASKLQSLELKYNMNYKTGGKDGVPVEKNKK